MKRLLWSIGITAGLAAFWLVAQSPGDPLIRGYRETEVASVADAVEQLYGQQAFMSHATRPQPAPSTSCRWRMARIMRESAA